MDTPMVEKSKLNEDLQGKSVDPTRYHGMTGSLMYLTSSRPYLVFLVCMCARYQAKPTKKHLHTTMTMLVAKIPEKVRLEVPSADRVKISSTNLRLETTVPQKEETFQVVIDVIKNSTSAESMLKSFKKILDVYLRVKGEEFTELQIVDDNLTFLIDHVYHKYTNMYVDHMSQPRRTLAAIINKCLSRKTASNDRLRISRINKIWGMFYRENVDYPELI
ncbi:hypothetical protein Tco_0891979 [Tanacetum coccineum]|uniref:Uncharacterized protein n=1 Tax=Tanacetum coccineum TaxID=301880 RepID=A0ABQ5C6F3_9ASTR